MKPHGYLRYYFLEDYLFNEVHAAFLTNGTLTPEEFLAIIIWKSNRQKTNVVAGALAAEKTVGELMRQIAEAADLEKVKLCSGEFEKARQKQSSHAASWVD